MHFLHVRALHRCLQCSIDVTHGYMRASASEMPFCHMGLPFEISILCKAVSSPSTLLCTVISAPTLMSLLGSCACAAPNSRNSSNNRLTGCSCNPNLCGRFLRVWSAICVRGCVAADKAMELLACHCPSRSSARSRQALELEEFEDIVVRLALVTIAANSECTTQICNS